MIHTVAPFQTADYSVAAICIQHKVHYIDLADGRDYVTHITSLSKQAIANNVLVVSGASTVPGLSAAVIEQYQNQFSTIDSLIYGISPAQKSPRGLATTKGILTYLGKPLKPVAGGTTQRIGWQNLYLQNYPELGKRWMGNCDIPDLDLFPEKYDIKDIQFSAGMESSILHLGIWFFSYLVRKHDYAGRIYERIKRIFNSSSRQDKLLLISAGYPVATHNHSFHQQYNNFYNNEPKYEN